MNGDSTPDIITIIDGVKVVILDGRDGREISAINISESICGIAVTDINGDGDYDIVIGKRKSMIAFLDMAKGGSDSLSLPCNLLFSGGYQGKKNKWTVVTDFDNVSLYEIFPRSPLNSELTSELKESFQDKFHNYHWSGVWYDIPPVIGDIDGDSKLELITVMGRVLYALKTNIPCVENSLVLPMAGLNYRHNNIIE